MMKVTRITENKDYSDNLKVSYFNSRVSRSTAKAGLPFIKSPTAENLGALAPGMKAA